ncbi:putative lysophospholipid acyltransferase (LPLAT) superfamily [Taylorella asinigenitalis 14/45]|uniref:L-ornithine N(alpha)-acyltransferase n=2 Tax=Taylorella asinigenitalis TaxID=84590 RepID=G4QBI3_TAYAM|nr:GNAT family N-acyltransferase [Taylorella asinigenitalis]AEP36961.1 Putative hemolysin [Taylorella asinigenitalis MCE3]CCG19478.1 putative lysophospholipid acyltransferase (LPLAT) superfamily [Taylorella asinigenitalis 14/45]
MRELLTTQATSREPSFTLSIATEPEEVKALQKLRHEIYSSELGVKFERDDIDIDYFDDFCDHLMVIDNDKKKVVGTYRTLSPKNAVKAGRYYSEGEFNIDSLNNIRPLLAECGRSCTHTDYRSGSVIMLLWAGLAKYMEFYQARYMLGCASVSLADGGFQAAEVWRYAKSEMEKHPERAEVIPLNPYPIEKLESLPENQDNQTKFHSLIKGYIKVGAYICGKPTFDESFNSCDFPIIIDKEAMDKRYYKQFDQFSKEVSA